MKNLFSKIFGNHIKSIPDVFGEELLKHFPNAVNVEWENKKNSYEAIFYIGDVEHIAHFSENAKLTEYKKNLWPAELPDKIAAKSREFGEVMNCIEIYRQENRFYEVIVRDTQYRRNLLLFDNSGHLLNSGKL